jgi:hypothetical protein
MYNNRVSIQEVAGKFKGFFSNTEYLLTILIIAVSFTSFWLGRLSMSTASPSGQSLSEIAASAAVSVSGEGSATSSVQTEAFSEGGYVASRNGTKYHLPWCSGAKQISEQNKVYFATKEEAEAAGYTPASNCKGI